MITFVLCSDEEAGDVKKNAAVSLLQDPNVMAALQGKLSTMIGTNSGYIQSLPAPVKKRLKALKKIQFEATKIEAQFYEEVHQLECKYHTKLEPLYSKRVNITKGTHEPTEDECEWPSESEDEEEQTLAKEVNEKAKLEEEKKKEEEEKDVKGVPQVGCDVHFCPEREKANVCLPVLANDLQERGDDRRHGAGG